MSLPLVTGVAPRWDATTAMLASSNREELQEMISRGVGVVQGAGLNRPGLRPTGSATPYKR